MSGVNETLAKELHERYKAYEARQRAATLGISGKFEALLHTDRVEDTGTPSQGSCLGELLLALADQVYWFNTKTVHQDAHGAAVKVGHEAVEFAAEPTLDEARDVLITLLGWLRLAGFTERQLVDAALAKMHVNIHERTWVRLPDGSYQHTTEEK